MIPNDDETEEALNSFFSNVIKTLGIPKNVYFDLLKMILMTLK